MPTGGRARRDTAIQSGAKSRRMLTTQCPTCGRKGALVTYLDDDFTGRYRRWVEQGKCDYKRVRAR